MSNDDLSVDQEETEGRNPVRERMKQLEADLATERQRAAEGDQARRELAFMKVGIDLSTPTGKLFAKAYDGDASVDAIREAAVEYGLVQAPSPVTADESEQQAWNRASSSHTSGSVSPADVDMVEQIRTASTPQELEALLRQVRATQQG